MLKKEVIFDGNEKQVFATEDPNKVIIEFNDVTVAFNNVKRARFVGKGALNNQISALLLNYLNENGVRTHFIEKLNDNEQLCRRIEIIPLEIIVRNRVCGSLALRLGLEGNSHANVVTTFSTIWDLFRLQRDETMVDKEKKYVTRSFNPNDCTRSFNDFT